MNARRPPLVEVHSWIFTTYPMSESVHIKSAVLADLKNVDVAFGILLLSCFKAEMKVLPA